MENRTLKEYSATQIRCPSESFQIGSGSYGAVLHAFHDTLDNVAVKCFIVTGSERLRKLLQKKIFSEYNKLQQISHPNIINVFGVSNWHGYMGIIMEFCQGGDLLYLLLDDVIDLGLGLILRINTEIASGVAYIHNCMLNKRMTHGDLKPENILLTLQLNCKITDFGCAQFINFTGSTTTTDTQREKQPLTLCYAAPEKLLSDARPKKEQDTYSCGIIQHVTLSREKPYLMDDNLVERVIQGLRPNCEAIEELKEESNANDKEIIEAIEGVMKRCWDQDPSKRPNMTDIRDYFKNLLEKQNRADIMQQVANALENLEMHYPPRNHTVPLNRFQIVEETKQLFISSRGSPASHAAEPEVALASNVMEPNRIASQIETTVSLSFLVIGGWNYERTCVQYNVESKQHEYLQNLNFPTCGATSVLVDRKVFVIGGAENWYSMEPYRTCHVLDTQEVSRFWNSLPDMKEPRKFCGSGNLEGVVFVTGGRNRVGILSSCEKLPIGGKEWLSVSSLHHARYAHGTVVCQGSLYCVGGRNNFMRLRSCERFDLGLGNWNAISDMNKARSEHACVALEGCIYAIGGFSDDDGSLDTVEKYNPQSNNWEFVASLRTPRSHSCACVVQNKIYVIGGRCNGSHLKSVEMYEVTSNSWTVCFETENPAWLATVVAM